MPIESAILIQNPSSEEFGALDYGVMPHAFASQNELGRLADEKVYQQDLASRLIQAQFAASREVGVTAQFRSYKKTYILDLVVASIGVYELKAVSKLTNAHRMQLLHYLRLLNIERGKLLNFGSKSVECEFINNPDSLTRRQNFQVARDSNQDDEAFRILLVELLRDWGTGLSLSLYQEAMTDLLGGYDNVYRAVPMQRDKHLLGEQKWSMHSSDAAFRLTAFTSNQDDYERQIRKLLIHSPIDRIQWANIELGVVSFKTIRRCE